MRFNSTQHNIKRMVHILYGISLKELPCWISLKFHLVPYSCPDVNKMFCCYLLDQEQQKYISHELTCACKYTFCWGVPVIFASPFTCKWNWIGNLFLMVPWFSKDPAKVVYHQVMELMTVSSPSTELLSVWIIFWPASCVLIPSNILTVVTAIFPEWVLLFLSGSTETWAAF